MHGISKTEVLWVPELGTAAPRGLCTDCGISRTVDAARCGTACQFIRPDYAAAERQVHGRSRQPEHADEGYFGPYLSLHRASLKVPAAGAQWSGITTRLAERLLEAGEVDAVLTVAPHPEDRWRPQPVIVTRASDMATCRGMRMGYAPTLALIEPALERGLTRLALVGIPCQVYALRALEAGWRKTHGLEALYVIGTPCSDNTTTENFHRFLARLSDRPESICYLEFCPDFHVELRFDNGQQRRIPFLQLPISDLPPDFFPVTCRTCVDYTNALADITVGYMGGEGRQWLIVRNERGRALLDMLGDEVLLEAPGSSGKRASSVRGFIANTERAAGGLPLRRMPNWLRPIVGRLMPRIGPKGLEFARARVEMKAAECVLHLRRLHPRRIKSMVPSHIWWQLRDYEITPTQAEQTTTATSTPESEPVEPTREPTS